MVCPSTRVGLKKGFRQAQVFPPCCCFELTSTICPCLPSVLELLKAQMTFVAEITMATCNLNVQRQLLWVVACFFMHVTLLFMLWRIWSSSRCRQLVLLQQTKKAIPLEIKCTSALLSVASSDFSQLQCWDAANSPKLHGIHSRVNRSSLHPFKHIVPFFLLVLLYCFLFFNEYPVLGHRIFFQEK